MALSISNRFLLAFTLNLYPTVCCLVGYPYDIGSILSYSLDIRSIEKFSSLRSKCRAEC